MNKIEKPRCEWCFYWDECGHHPGNIDIKNGNCNIKESYSLKKGKDWCGQWRSAEPPYWTLDMMFESAQSRKDKDIAQKYYKAGESAEREKILERIDAIWGGQTSAGAIRSIYNAIKNGEHWEGDK